MHPIIVNDFIYGKEIIISVKDLNVNLTSTNDLKVKGILVYEGKEEPFEKEIKYDKNLFSNEVYIQDISYELNGKTVLLSIQINEKEIAKRIDLEEEYNNLLNNKDLEVISTVDDLPQSDILEIVDEQDKEDENKESYIEEKEEIEKDDNEEKEIKREEEKEIIKKKDNSLFNDEYVSSFFFYRIKENETLSDIANKFKVNKDNLLAANPKKSFLPNELILIPQ